MSLWNPYAFSVTGQPIFAQSPPALRVQGGQASAQQLAMAQHAFAQFCAHARLSVVPNPTEIGRLADGTPYRITAVGPQTIMEIWPVGEIGSSLRPGIGVVSATGYWVLRPPGSALTPAPGPWKAELVDAISGGAVYVFTRSNYFVEAPSGVSRGNKRLADSIFGALGSRYVSASNKFDVSNLFLAGGAIMQLKCDGDSLTLGRRAISAGGLSDALTISAHALPNVPDGDKWGMVSTSTTGGQIVVCRTENDPDVPEGGQIHSRVRAAAHLTHEIPPGTIRTGPTQTFPLEVSHRTPNEAPTKSRWSASETRSISPYTVTLNNPNPFAAEPTFEVNAVADLDLGRYDEGAHFESVSTYRAYISSAGLLVEDELRRLDSAVVTSNYDSSYRGYEFDDWWDYTISGNRNAHATIDRSEEVLFGGAQAVKLYSAKIDYDYRFDGDSHISTSFASYQYGSNGQIIGFRFVISASTAALATSTGKIHRSSEVVLVVDEQFDVIVTARASIEATLSLRSGHPRITESGSGDNLVVSIIRGEEPFPTPPVDEISYSSKMTVSLELLHGTARTSIGLDLPEWVEGQVEVITRNLFDEISERAAPPSEPGSPIATEGVRDNRFFGERGLTEIMDAVFSERLGAAMYAKDPKTGAGLLSFDWGGKQYNFVVGPWGVASSESRTDFAQDAAIYSLQSV